MTDEVWFYLVVDGVVIQKQPFFEDGFIEGPFEVYPGYFYSNGVYTAPPPPPVDYLALNTAELERLQRLANAQVTALQGRVNNLNWVINEQDPDDEDYEPATPAEIAEYAVVKALLTKWNTYTRNLGKVKAQPDWPTNPIWPVQPTPYTSETSAVISTDLS